MLIAIGLNHINIFAETGEYYLYSYWIKEFNLALGRFLYLFDYVVHVLKIFHMFNSCTTKRDFNLEIFLNYSI